MISHAGGSTYATRYLTGWNVTSPWQNFAIVDLGGDGKAEIVAQDSATGAWWGIFVTSTGFDSRLLIAGSANRRSNGLQVVDSNHDGINELIGRDPATNQWWSLSMTGTTTTVQSLGTINLSRVTVGTIPGVSDAAFKQWLLKTIPNLKSALSTDRLQAARLLMNWASNNADGAISSELQSSTNDQISSLSRPSDLFKDFFDPDRGGVYCGGFSIFYNNILKLFGYDSFTLNFGDLRDDLTHVTVIVPIANGTNDWNYYIFDPTFNTVFMAPGTTRQLTVQEMLLYYRQGMMNQITAVQDSIAEREWLALGIVNQTQYIHKTQVQAAGLTVEVYSRPTYSISTWTYEISSTLTRYGYSTGTTGYLQLLTNRIFTVGQSSNSAVRDRFIYYLQAYGVSV